jgi:periplasmic copper chaperone A
MKGNMMKLKMCLPAGFSLSAALGASALFCAMPSLAHVVLAEPTAAAGSYYRATLKVGHGCEGSSTTAIMVTIPDGFESVKPMPKSGWTIEIKMEKLAKPLESHGKTINETVRQITWRGGPLPDQHYDEFVMMAKVPGQAGKHWLPVIQTCEKGAIEWTQIPSAGKTWKDLKTPAAELNVIPAMVNAPHKH